MNTLRIETESRWDALALVEKLPRHRWHLVEPDAHSCDVYVTVAEEATDLPGDLVESIEHWLREREVEKVTVRGEERTYSVAAPAAPRSSIGTKARSSAPV
jgi:uncharacterized protein (UPF0218 family)